VSVIADYTRDPPRLGAMVPIPAGQDAAWIGMYVAAWARAEHCDVSILDGGQLELRCRYTPTDALSWAFGKFRAYVVGVFGFGVPLLYHRPDRWHPYAASWEHRWERD
jgi:hypothetical protein